MQPQAQIAEIEVSTVSRATLRQLLVEPTESTAIQFIRYVFVGGFAFLIDIGTLYVLTSRAGVNYLVAAAVAFLLGLIANYLLSRSWVFPRRGTRNAGVEFAVFTLIGLVGLGLNELGMWLLVSAFGLHVLVSKMCTTAVVFFWNFTARKMSLFR